MSEESIDYKALIEHQLQQWPQAAQAYEALRGAQTRLLDTCGCTMTLQHNPARVKSSAASIDAASIARRGCFLCRDARPAQQLFVEADGYELLVNPYPIFPLHLTIPLAKHAPQQIRGRIEHMVRWAKRLDGMTVFYNGARCGASAPDHMHFQAVPTSMLPIWQWIDSGNLPEAPAFLLCGSATEAEATLDKLPHTPDMEPDVNVLCRHIGSSTHIVIVPRRKHRPDCYGTSDGCVLLSPASVDMGGVWVLPREQDFLSLTADKLKEIILQTTFTRQEICH